MSHKRTPIVDKMHLKKIRQTSGFSHRAGHEVKLLHELLFSSNTGDAL